METIYRVQDFEGRGPFRPGFSRVWVETRDDLENLHPCFEGIARAHRNGKASSSYGTGCRTIDGLRRWFTLGEYMTLLCYGYRAVKMEVDRVYDETGTQVVFERAKRLNEDFTEVLLYSIE